METIYIPTINDYLGDFKKLFVLWNQVQGNGRNLKFEFSQCNFLRQNAVAFLGGLAKLVEHRRGSVQFAWDSLQSDILANLEKNDFLKTFGNCIGTSPGNSIPYRQDMEQDNSELVDYLKSKWLGRGWLHVSPHLRNAIVNRVWEIYANAFEHAESPIGIFSCGQHYPNKHELALTVVDFGVGIPSNVRKFIGNPVIPAANTLEWAFQSGASTKSNGLWRGVGLDLLKKFVKLNDGRMLLFSHEGYAKITKNEESYRNHSAFFQGTLVNITLRCDEKYYRFTDEVPPVRW